MKELLASVTQFVVIDNEQGYRAERCPTCRTPINKGRTRVTPGLADLILVGHGFGAVFVELKSESGRVRDSQKRFAAGILAVGGLWLLWRSARDCWDWLESQGIVKRGSP